MHKNIIKHKHICGEIIKYKYTDVKDIKYIKNKINNCKNNNLSSMTYPIIDKQYGHEYHLIAEIGSSNEMIDISLNDVLFLTGTSLFKDVVIHAKCINCNFVYMICRHQNVYKDHDNELTIINNTITTRTEIEDFIDRANNGLIRDYCVDKYGELIRMSHCGDILIDSILP